MNRVAAIALVATVLASAGASAGDKGHPASNRPAKAKPSSRKATAAYTCSMHPDVKSANPGKCPKCGMNLVPTKNAAGGAK